MRIEVEVVCLVVILLTGVLYVESSQQGQGMADLSPTGENLMYQACDPRVHPNMTQVSLPNDDVTTYAGLATMDFASSPGPLSDVLLRCNPQIQSSMDTIDIDEACYRNETKYREFSVVFDVTFACRGTTVPPGSNYQVTLLADIVVPNSGSKTPLQVTGVYQIG